MSQEDRTRGRRIFTKGLPTTQELKGTSRTYEADSPAQEAVLFDFPWLLGFLPYGPDTVQGRQFFGIRVCKPADFEIQRFLKSSGSIRGRVGLSLGTGLGWRLRINQQEIGSYGMTDGVRTGFTLWGQEIQIRGGISEGYCDLLSFAIQQIAPSVLRIIGA